MVRISDRLRALLVDGIERLVLRFAVVPDSSLTEPQKNKHGLFLGLLVMRMLEASVPNRPLPFLRNHNTPCQRLGRQF
uniref:Uncharacterized protein n=1 Tax=Brassica oleracea var. oleracea TaxID=109376 RepID=A0A0D3B3U3_BRAOL